MRHLRLISIFRIAFVLGMVSPTALAQNAIPGALFHLDAITQIRRDRTWENLGALGGVLAPNEATPELKAGTIRIPEIGFRRRTQWYKIEGRHQGFFSDSDVTPNLMLKDWTIEFLTMRNGPKWANLIVASQFAGFRWGNDQGLRILLHGGDSGKLNVWIKGEKEKGKWFAADDVGVDLGKKEWHWLAFVFTNRKHLEVYQNGTKVSTLETNQDFNPELPMSMTLFSAWNRDHTFNGSMAVVRIYDRPLKVKELNRNISGDLPIDPKIRFTTMWAEFKNR